jgi:spermidine synthase
MEKSGQGRVGIVLLGFLLSGVAALIYEIVWTRALSLVLGSTTYALSTMLATFMGGLALGAFVGGRLADRRQNLLRWFGLCELGIGLAGLASVPLIYSLPAVYLWIYRSFHLYPALYFLLQIGLCALVMAVPTVLMGATFPIVSRATTLKFSEMGARVGSAYGFNTVGAVVGALAAGFLLVPILGVKGSAVVAAALNLGVGITMLALGRAPVAAVAAAPLLYLLAGFWAASANPETSLLNFYTARRHLDDTSYGRLAETEARSFERLLGRQYREGHVRALRSITDGELVLQVAGKIESGALDRQSALLAAYLPIAAHPSPESILVIGLGAGRTVSAAKAHVERVDVVEINSGVVEAVERFGAPGLLDDLRIVRNDARNFLLTSNKTYSVITSVPSVPAEAGVSNLFTTEFFDLVARHLDEEGVYCQWLPYQIMTNDDVTMMVRTFGSVFPNASLWRLSDSLDLMLLGSLRPFRISDAMIPVRVAALNTAAQPLRFSLSRGGDEIRRIAENVTIPMNTDDHPRLEFRIARNILLGGPEARESGETPRHGESDARERP